jgi:hypothetical protein
MITGNLDTEPQKSGISTARFAVFLLLLLVITYPTVFSLSQTFVSRDFGTFDYPLAVFHRDCVHDGFMPLWNPYNHCGLPFLAQWNSMTLYPLSAFYLVFPVQWALGILGLIHLYLAGLGMFLLARRWSGSDFGAAVAGIVIAFNGLAFNFMLWPNNAAGYAWMPWLILLLEKAVMGGESPPQTRRAIVVAGIVGSLQMLAGAPEVIFQTWIIAGVVVLTAAPALAPVPLLQRFSRAGLVLLLTVGLSAAQLLPTLDLIQHSHRTTDFAGTIWAMPWWGWGNFLVPLLHSFAWQSGVFFQHDQYWTSSYYLGIGPIILALAAAWRLRNLRWTLLTLTGLGALLMALGSAGYLHSLVKQCFPFLGFMRYPIKFVVTAVFLVPLLSAMMIAWLEKETENNPERVRRCLSVLGFVTVLIMAGLLLLMRTNPQPWDDWPAAWQSALSRAVFGAITLLVLFQALRMQDFKTKCLLQVGLLLLIWLDLRTHAPNLVLTAATGVYEPDVARGREQPKLDLGQGRALLPLDAKKLFYNTVLADPEKDFMGRRLAAFADCNLLDHLPKVDGFFSLYPKEYQEVLAAGYYHTNGFPSALADFLGVTHTNSSASPFAWNPRGSALPLAMAGLKPEFVSSNEFKNKIRDGSFSPQTTVYLAKELETQTTVKHAAPARVNITTWQPNRVELLVNAEAPAWVVLSQSGYHWWRAYSDGQPIPLHRANYAFQAFETTAGQHRITLAYEDKSFLLGGMVSICTLLLCVAGLALSTRRKP